MTNTQFSLDGRNLTLIRYPAEHQHKSLQAWDSADELMIRHCDELLTDQHQLSIFNDDFGALGCCYADRQPLWVSDSWIAHQSLRENLTRNEAPPELDPSGRVNAPVQAQSSTQPLTGKSDVVLIKVPRTLALLEQQLIDLRAVITPGTHIIAAGKVKSVTRSVLALFERYIGPTRTSLASKKSRLIFTEPAPEILSQRLTSPYPTNWTARLATGQLVSVSNHANVFSRQSLDIGARFLLEHMQVKAGEKVVDLGCGNGVLGLNALALAPDCEVIFADESFMALASAERNVAENFPAQLSQCRFVASNCLESLLQTPDPTPVNRILCNPPFHQQNAITDHIAWQMFHDSRALLAKGGHLIVVANRHLDYHVKLKRLFGGVKVLASQQKFVILSAAKR
ncbi:methyltransferase [Alteromonas sp. ASW11-19]|uniref:Ribosomal RNA large subunit methyltransferase G n=1 Tax=Alteromonas salexigens TaxID=2982530 RepID=A0ABT2VJR5_9ALTE|nr:methyltransferase [Alteromonas salexigens]MCU7553043.1 methyltransferase [Alteromonas salexigens]